MTVLSLAHLQQICYNSRHLCRYGGPLRNEAYSEPLAAALGDSRHLVRFNRHGFGTEWMQQPDRCYSYAYQNA